MTGRNNIIYPKDCQPGDDRRNKMLTFKAFRPFIEAMDTYWKENGYRSRTHFVFRTVAKKIKWRGEI